MSQTLCNRVLMVFVKDYFLTQKSFIFPHTKMNAQKVSLLFLSYNGF